MSTPRRQLSGLIEQGVIPAEKINAALAIATVTPSGKSWRNFLDHLLLWLGGLSLAFALLFFIAYNWEDFGRFAKFGMVQGAVVLAIVAYCLFAEGSMAGKISLLAATISLGVLLALYGQTYQTGADPWQLFFNWALLMLPWAIIGRFPAIWIVWVTLMNVAIILYYSVFGGLFGGFFGSGTDVLWVLFLFNTLVFIVWQWLAMAWSWLSEAWAVRLLALGSGIPLTLLVLVAIFDYQEAGIYPGLVWAVWLAAMYYVYRRWRPDLFMLAGCCLSTITVSVSFLGNHMLADWDAGAFLFLAFVVIGMGSGAALWLKKVHSESLS